MNIKLFYLLIANTGLRESLCNENIVYETPFKSGKISKVKSLTYVDSFAVSLHQ